MAALSPAGPPPMTMASSVGVSFFMWRTMGQVARSTSKDMKGRQVAAGGACMGQLSSVGLKGGREMPVAIHRHGIMEVGMNRFLQVLGRWRQEPLIPAVLLLIAGGLWIFLEIADEIGEGESHHIDEAILLAMREPGDLSNPIGSGRLEEMGRDLTALGGFTILTGLTLVSIGIALFLKRPRIAALIAIAITSGSFLSTLLKRGFDRPRPDLVPHGTVVTNASFPSGHSMMAAVVYLTLGILLARTQTSRPLRIYLIAVSVIVTVLVGVSRVYLGVHWPTDVLAGWTVGAAWALLFGLIALRIDKR
ncbi:phosphatase PAP2 family protein [Luteolibacter arcticus]|uniref:Phosphatase PAP2 family protein n=1 Tax=Luteolibacter arcticus TaxID=1581411 RepID=A0ABT3GQR8_9BACT|nr:phosphatase PAP2 family protein [Luteolibacter arcticus]MCW1925837.1 phosphatase PAP2 family protein [Luteolibacter arcticus]